MESIPKLIETSRNRYEKKRRNHKNDRKIRKTNQFYVQEIDFKFKISFGISQIQNRHQKMISWDKHSRMAHSSHVVWFIQSGWAKWLSVSRTFVYWSRSQKTWFNNPPFVAHRWLDGDIKTLYSALFASRIILCQLTSVSRVDRFRFLHSPRKMCMFLQPKL